MTDTCGTRDAHCITCSDEGTAMSVVTAGADTAACRDEAGAMHEVAIDLVGPVTAGDGLLVHAGVAIRALDLTGAP